MVCDVLMIHRILLIGSSVEDGIGTGIGIGMEGARGDWYEQVSFMDCGILYG